MGFKNKFKKWLYCFANFITNLFKTLAGCPAGWYGYGSHCYQVFEKKLSWQDAENFCQIEGGHLASVHSAGENNFLSKLNSATMWLGGTDAKTDGTWEWSDGSRFSFDNWAPGEPNNINKDQHCLTTNFKTTGQWDDANGIHKMKFACKKKIDQQEEKFEVVNDKDDKLAEKFKNSGRYTRYRNLF